MYLKNKVNKIKEKGKDYMKKAGYGIGALAIAASLMTGSADASNINDDYQNEVLNEMNNQSVLELSYDSLDLEDRDNLEDEINNESNSYSYKESLILDDLRSDNLSAIEQYESIDKWLDDMYRGNLKPAHYEQVIGNETWIKQLSIIDGDDVSYDEMKDTLQSKYDRALRRERRERDLDRDERDSPEVTKWRDLDTDEILERLDELDTDEDLEEIVDDEKIEKPTPDKVYEPDLDEEKEDYKVDDTYEPTEDPDDEYVVDTTDDEIEDDNDYDPIEEDPSDLEEILDEEKEVERKSDINRNYVSFEYGQNQGAGTSDIYDTTGDGVTFEYDQSSEKNIEVGFEIPDTDFNVSGSYFSRDLEGDMVYGIDTDNEMEVGDATKNQTLLSLGVGYDFDENLNTSIGVNKYDEEKIANFEDDDRDYTFEDSDIIPEVNVRQIIDINDSDELALEGTLDYSTSDSELGFRLGGDYYFGDNRVGLDFDNTKVSDRLNERSMSISADRTFNDDYNVGVSYNKSLEDDVGDSIGINASYTYEDLMLKFGVDRGIDDDELESILGLELSF